MTKMRKPPLNKTAGMILNVLLAPETNGLQKKEELIKMISLKSLIIYKWYQIQYWYWKMEKDYDENCKKVEIRENKQRTMIKVKI